MKRFAIALSLALCSAAALASDTYTQGYFRSDGTYVAPHYQTQRDSNLYNNYSSQGQVNPYTGQVGTRRNEYSMPPAYQKSSPLYTPSPSYTSPYSTSSQQRRYTADPYRW